MIPPPPAAIPETRGVMRTCPSRRRGELPLGFEPILPVGAEGLSPRLPEVIGVDRDLLAGGRRDLPYRVEDAGTSLCSTRFGSVWCAAGVGGVPPFPVEVARLRADCRLNMLDPSFPGCDIRRNSAPGAISMQTRQSDLRGRTIALPVADDPIDSRPGPGDGGSDATIGLPPPSQGHRSGYYATRGASLTRARPGRRDRPLSGVVPSFHRDSSPDHLVASIEAPCPS